MAASSALRTKQGRFLEQYAIPDQFLMLGLDRLTRDEDYKTKKLVLIDFKSLVCGSWAASMKGCSNLRWENRR